MSGDTPFSPDSTTEKASFVEMDDPNAMAGRLVLRAAIEEPVESEANGSTPHFDADIDEAPSVTTPWLMIASGAMAALWAGGAGAFLLGYSQTGAFAQASTPLLAGLGAVALGPVAFLLLAGAMGEALRRASREAKALTAAAARISQPGPEAERAARTVAGAVRREIDALEAAITATLNRLAAVEGGIAQRANALAGAGHVARESASEVSKALAEGILQLTAAADALAEQSGQFASLHEGRATALLKSARIADSAAREAAELFGAKARDVLAVSTQTAQNTSAHAATLEAASMRLDNAALRAAANAAALSDAIAQADAALARAASLFSLSRTEISATVDQATAASESLSGVAHTALDEAARLAAIGTDIRSSVSQDAENRLDQLRNSLAERAAAMVTTLRAEAESARLAAEEGLSALQRTADIARAAAVAAGQAAAAEAGAAEKRLQSLGETAFEAGKRADTIADSRMNEARALVERSVELLSVAGDRITDRFAATAAACTEQTRAVEAVLAGLQSTAAAIPERAAEQTRAIEQSLEASLARLNQAGRGALEEAAQIDEAFQLRLRESYAALGDIVARLGGFAGVTGAIPPPPMRPLQTIASLPSTPAIQPNAAPGVTPQDDGAEREPEIIQEKVLAADDLLFDAEFKKAGGVAQGDRETWRWKDLLATLDAGKSPHDQPPKDDVTVLREALLGLSLGSTGYMTDAAIARIGVAGAMRADSRRRAVKQYAPEGLQRMAERIAEPHLREAAIRFVSAHEDAASRNALNDELTALYLIVDAALES